MLKIINNVLAECDNCGKIEKFQNKEETFSNGWEEVKDKIYCKNCIGKFNSLQYEVCEEDYVVSLIDDDPRHLVKREEYKVNELVFLSSFANEEHKKNLTIYVDVGNGWQARLDKGEYELA